MWLACNTKSREKKRRGRFTCSYLSIATGLMGVIPDEVTIASTGTSYGVIGIIPLSKICKEYDSATAEKEHALSKYN